MKSNFPRLIEYPQIVCSIDPLLMHSHWTSLIWQEDQQGLSNSSTGEKGDELIKVLRDLTAVQRNIANLQVELQGRKVIDMCIAVYFWFHDLVLVSMVAEAELLLMIIYCSVVPQETNTVDLFRL